MSQPIEESGHWQGVRTVAWCAMEAGATKSERALPSCDPAELGSALPDGVSACRTEIRRQIYWDTGVDALKIHPTVTFVRFCSKVLVQKGTSILLVSRR